MSLIASFNKAPLSEVVCGVEFNAPDFSSIHFGLYWQSIRDRFPAPPLDQPPIGVLEIIAPIPSLRRVWFESVDRRRLIQLQANRFHYNWKRLAEHDEYPHFDVLYPHFEKEWNAFQEWWIELDKLPIQPMYYELTYLNQIDAALGWSSPKDTPKLFSFLNVSLPDALPQLVSHDCSMVFSLPDERGSLVMRLNQGMQIENGSNVLILELTARSSHCNIPISTWFSKSHEDIVRTFVRLLSETAKASWGLTWLEQ
jgi:uncharacterized protein (TIGR04255 family)